MKNVTDDLIRIDLNHEKPLRYNPINMMMIIIMIQ